MKTMSEAIIKTKQLNFGFTKQSQILHDINLEVEKGAIYGFLGQNGAGKTTTLRLLLGLLKPPGHCVRLFGEEINKNPTGIYEKVGAFIESPSLYEHLTGYDNLKITTVLRGLPKKRIDEVLEIVHLFKSSHIKVKNYSLGMKQRLALALALLSKPELLILDEPTNGLDPNGINETRELLLELNRNHGTTILISSHLLSEIEKMVTHLGIIHRGRLSFQGTIDELLQKYQIKSSLFIQTNDNIKAVGILQTIYAARLNVKGMIEIIIDDAEQADPINKILIKNGIDVLQLQVVNTDLETIYLKMTKN